MVAKKIKSMKDNKSHGGWNSAKTTDGNIKQISIPFPRVFNLQLIEGVVSFEWKKANIKPLFKKDSRNKSENYLISMICTLLETLIKDRMLDFFVGYELINPSQHGLSLKDGVVPVEWKEANIADYTLMNKCWNLNKPMASLSICHLGL